METNMNHMPCEQHSSLAARVLLRRALPWTALSAALLALVFTAPALHATDKPAAQPAAAKAPKPDDKAACEDEVVAFLKKYEPELHDSAMVLREKDETKFHHWMQAMGPEVKDLQALQKSDPDRFDLTMQDRRLAWKALQLSKQLSELQKKNNAKGDQLDKTSAELLKTVTQQFDLQQKLHQRELDAQTERLERLQHQLDGLKKELDNREKNRDELINRHIAELMKNPHSWTKW